MPDEKAWWNHWITVIIGIVTLAGTVAGGINFLYYNFVTKELHKTHMEQVVGQYSTLEKETVQQFGKLNKEMRRDDLKDSYDKLSDQKYDIIKRLGCGTLTIDAKLELEQDLEKTRDRLLIIAAELKTLRAEIE